MDMAPSRTQLQSLFQKTSESFKEYAQRWRELAARVQPPMLERELTDMFIRTLQGVFMDRMGSCPFGSFRMLRFAEKELKVLSKREKSKTLVLQVLQVLKNHFQGHPEGERVRQMPYIIREMEAEDNNIVKLLL